MRKLGASFTLSLKTLNFVETQAKKQHITRSRYIESLIEKEAQEVKASQEMLEARDEEKTRCSEAVNTI